MGVSGATGLDCKPFWFQRLGWFVRRTISGLLLVLLWAPGLAVAQESTRYVSDEITIVLRDSPRAEGGARGVVTSGMRVTVLGTDEPSGYVRVRTGDGREGWMLARHLKGDPIARDKLKTLDKDLVAAQAELKKLKEENARLTADFARISGGEPIASRELVQETENLRAQLKQKDQDVAQLREQYDVEVASQKTLLLGGALVAAGFLLALLVRWLWPKRRWGDF
jgi:SH3 domain protein